MFCKRKYWDIRYINQQIALKTGEKNLEPSVFFSARNLHFLQ